MKIDTQELQQLIAVQARVDIYASVHKAVRAYIADTLIRVGRLDVSDPQDLDGACAQVLDLLDFCTAHLGHENAFIHPAMEARQPGDSATVASDHVEHELHIAGLRQAAMQLPAVPQGERQALATQLYRQLALFLADNLQHMAVEEGANNGVLWEHYTDGELLELHDALVRSIPPQEMMVVMRWMLPHLNHGERLALLADVRAKAPAPAFEAIVDLARERLDGPAWGKLARALGLAVVPGLAG